MNNLGMGCRVANLFRALFVTLLMAALSACGGGGGSAGTTSGGGGVPKTPNGAIAVALYDATGAANNVLSGSTTLTAKATVTDANGAAAPNVVVTFTLSSAIAALSPVSGTALTDSKGVAQISLKPGVGTGAGTLTASATVVGATAVTGTVNFSVSSGTGPTVTPTAINFVSAVPADKSIVIKGAGGNGRTEAALLTFTVVDNNNVGIANVKVDFATQSTYPVTLTAATGLTDATGKVTVAVNSGTQPTTARVIATVDGTTISSLSDTLTVTTGVPVQAAMSLSLGSLWVEGINYDGKTDKVAVRLADQFGGAVADGTQVVFTTNVGSVAGLGGAQCVTNGPNITNDPAFPGFCSIFWSSQNPRSNGVATIIATATNGTTNLSQSETFYVLGSYAKIYKIAAGGVEGNTTRQTSGGNIPMDFTTNCSVQTLNFEIVDVNDNPMPPGSTITVTAATTGLTVGLPSPAPVPMWNIGQLGVGTAPQRGTVHSIQVTPPTAGTTTCNSAGATPQTATFNLTVTSPAGNVNSTQVVVSYKST